MNQKEQIERQAKIIAGVKIAYERMLEFKRQKNSELIVAREGEGYQNKVQQQLMKLINTLEINSYEYSKNEYTFPNRESATPSEWNDFWLKCISDSGLGGLNSLYHGSNLVDIETIKSEQLIEILKKELTRIDPDEFEEQAEHLCGGVAVEVADKIIITPSCCGDLANLSG